mmetsp:Transcript_23002/g.66917  ORF Transcript_23002/g.66917 Transcript_23002/m.66917 type:complete len:217 (-) Transcript_23002:371-1021(-)
MGPPAFLEWSEPPLWVHVSTWCFAQREFAACQSVFGSGRSMTPSMGVLLWSSSSDSMKPMRNQNLRSSSFLWTSSMSVMGVGRALPKFVGIREKNLEERRASSAGLPPISALISSKTAMPLSICEAESLPRAWSAPPSPSPSASSVSTSWYLPKCLTKWSLFSQALRVLSWNFFLKSRIAPSGSGYHVILPRPGSPTLPQRFQAANPSSPCRTWMM